MSARPISEGRDAVLLGSLAALQRTALRAREVTTQTGAAIVVSQNGVIVPFFPPFSAAPDVAGNQAGHQGNAAPGDTAP